MVHHCSKTFIMDERMVKNKRKKTWKCDIGLKINPRQKGDILLVDHVLEYTEFTYNIISFDEKDLMLVMEEHVAWFRAPNMDRCHLGLRRLIRSRHQSSRPQGWKSAGQDINLPDLKDGRVPYHLSKSRMISSPFQNCRTGVILAFVGQDINLPDLMDGRVPYHLSKSRMISSPFQNCRTGVILAFVGQDINLPDLKDGRVPIAGPVSSWPSSFDRVKTSIFPTSRMEECRLVSSWPSSFDRVKTSIFPTSRMEECRPMSSWPSSFDRVKTSIFPTSRMEECRPVSSWPSSVDRVETSIFRPQGWKSAGQDINLPDLKDGRVPYHLSKSRMISSPFQNCRTGVILAFVGQDINLPDLMDGRVPYHLSKSRMISSPFQNCRTGVILAFVGQDINLPDLKDGRVPYHLSKSRMISSPFQNCRTGVILAFVGQDINLPDLKDGRVPYHLSKSRMISSPFQNCRTGVILAFDWCHPWPSSVDRVKAFIFPTSGMEESEISNTGREQSCRTLQPEGKHEEKGRVISPFLQVGRPKKMLLQVRKAHLLQGSSIFPQAAMKQTDWICQLNDFGRKGPESATTYYLRLKFCLIPSGAKEQTQRIESFDLASSGSKEQIEVVTQRPWIKFVITLQFGQIKIGAFWSLPDSRFSAMCKEGQL
ncbi:hypothetical protein GQ457_03G018750 [Hibiscus cannabinus]